MLRELLAEANWGADRIEGWLRQMKVEGCTVNSDGTVDARGDVNLFNRKLDNLPVRFRNVNGDFLVRHNRFKTLRGFPQQIGGNLSVSHNPGLELRGGPGIRVGGRVLLAGIELTTLRGVGQSFKEISGAAPNLDLSEYDIESGGIGLILVEGLKPRFRTWGKFKKASEIIERHLGQGKKGVLLCQEELHEAGLEAFAKL